MNETLAIDEGLSIVSDAAIGFPAPPNTYRSVAYANTEPGSQKATWLTVRPDGSPVAYAGKVEYGQGIRSGLALEVAEELCVPLETVEVVLSDTDRVPWDMGTFGSQSTSRVGLQLRKAAATARQRLLELAADRLDLPVDQLACREGRVVSQGDGSRSVSYADLLADQRLVHDLDDEAPLHQPGEFTLMGKPAPRIDAVARVTGQAQFSQDIMLPGMLFAAVLRPPTYHAKLLDIDTSIAELLPGVVQVVHDGDLVAMLAETDEQAERALDLVEARWEETPGQPSQWDMPDLLLSSAHDEFVTQEAGSLEDGFRAADSVLETRYYVPFVSNAPMEPRASVAQWEDGRLTVWAGTQRPFGIRAELAQRFEIDEGLVRVIAPEVGGGFGAKSPYRPAHEAAQLAKLAGRPVRVAYSRAEEMAWSTFRPAALIDVKSGFKADGTIVAWESKGYHAGDRPFLGRRGSDTPYAVPNVRVATFTSDSPLRSGSYRSLGGAANHFARESHMDEIAVAVGLDPVELRLRNLTHARFRGVLEAAAQRFGWSAATAPSQRGVGVALGLDVGSYVAMCLQLDIQGTEVTVQRVAAALDCGLTVNPDGAANQVEGSIVMGLGTALYEAIEFQGGRVLNNGFARYRVPRITNAPEIEVALVGDPDTPSTGAGEPGIVPVAAAVANAVFDLTGQRIRELPIQRHLG
ncbi:MAG: molybdopterin cofactor-binding domain-containing protein [Dehalococcoidia bacterium]